MQLTPRKVLAFIGIAILLLLGWFAWQLLGPAPEIVVSQATTYVTEPLRATGLPDYEAYMLELYRDGATPRNNAAIPFWQAVGPGDMDPAEFAAIAEEIGLRIIPDKGDCLQEIGSDEVRNRVIEWIEETNILPKDDEEEFGLEAGEWSSRGLADELIDQAQDRPWTGEQIPPLADWIKANEKHLDLLVAASHAPRFYLPSPELLNDELDPLISMSLSNIQASRDAARSLSARAMWNLGEGNYEAAWNDLIAIYRWSRLIGQGHTLVEQLISIALEGVANQSTLYLLETPGVPVELLKQMQTDLRTLLPRRTMAGALNGGERIAILSTLLALREGTTGDAYMDDKLRSALTIVSVDWNIPLHDLNAHYDELVAAAKLPTWTERQAAFDAHHNRLLQIEQSISARRAAGGLLSRQVRSELIGDLFAALMLPATSAAHVAEDRANTFLTLTQLAAAIAQYRAEHGEYPDKLESLVPGILPQLPVDLYHSKPFAYRRTAEGYLLYSVGPNGKDDAGSSQEMSTFNGYSTGIEPVETLYELLGDEMPADFDATDEFATLDTHIPQDADDYAIRVPLPKFELPKAK